MPLPLAGVVPARNMLELLEEFPALACGRARRRKTDDSDCPFFRHSPRACLPRAYSGGDDGFPALAGA
jgi:hypothetical protein